MRASRTARTVATSRGFRADWQETSCSIELWGDEIAGASYGRRCLPDRDATSSGSRRGGRAGAAACRRSTICRPTARGVLFMPTVVDELLGRLLLPNLSGRAIRDGRSPFSRADLEARRQIVRADLDLVIDTTLPFELATAPCSSEGVPAGRVQLIAGGRLASPIAGSRDGGGVRAAADAGPARSAAGACSRARCPTIELRRGAGAARRRRRGARSARPAHPAGATGRVRARRARRAGRRGRRGRRAVRRPAGRRICSDHLSQPSTRLVRIPGDPCVGLLVLTGVELLPA